MNQQTSSVSSTDLSRAAQWRLMRKWLAGNVHKTFQWVNTTESNSGPMTAGKWMQDRIALHPTWKNRLDDIVRFRVTRSRLNKALCLQLKLNTRTRRPWQTVAWRKCVTGPSQPIQPLAQAMRYAVRRQIAGFRRQHPERVCAACQAAGGSEYHVDHVEPFRALKQRFVAQTVHPVPMIVYRAQCQAALSPGPFTRAWQAFHRRHATLQWLCATCNLQKGGKAENADRPADPGVCEPGHDESQRGSEVSASPGR